MIKISIDEASAFDILSVQEIKISKLEDCLNKEYLLKNIQILKREISEQIGEDKFYQVYKSEEYFSLLDLNSNIFDLISLEENTKKSKVQEKNHRRYLQKKKIQELYFRSKLSEQKI